MTKENKKLAYDFAIIFIIVFLAFNWSYISWLFNYNFLSKAFSSFTEHAVSAPNDSEKSVSTGKANSIEIPAIEITAPLIIGESQDESILESELNSGVVYFPGSVLPGENGQTVILGHSAPLNWPKIKYDWVFSNISKLQAGDEILVYYNDKEYKYIVKSHSIIEKGQDLPNPLTNSDNMLLLVSCWPPGKDYQRMTVEAELIK